VRTGLISRAAREVSERTIESQLWLVPCRHRVCRSQTTEQSGEIAGGKIDRPPAKKLGILVSEHSTTLSASLDANVIRELPDEPEFPVIDDAV